MSITLPKHAKKKPSPHLYFKKFPHKLEISLARDAYSGHSNWRKAGDVLQQVSVAIKPHLPAEKTAYRKRSDWYTFSVFLEKAEDLQAIIDGTSLKFGKAKVVATVFTMTDDQVEASKLDAKIEYRKELYHGLYTYRLQCRGGDDQSLDALEAQFFTDAEIENFKKRLEQLDAQRKAHNANRGWGAPAKVERYGRQIVGENARMQYGRAWSNTIVYTTSEEDAAMARLMLPNSTKITKAIVSK